MQEFFALLGIYFKIQKKIRSKRPDLKLGYEKTFILIHDTEAFLSGTDLIKLLDIKKNGVSNALAVGLLAFSKIEHVRPVIDSFYKNE